MFDLESYDRMGLADLGLRHLNLIEAGNLIARCVWLEGQLPEKERAKIKGIPEKDSYSALDPDLDKPLAELSKKYTKLLVGAIERGTLKAAKISRNLEDTILEKSTFVSGDILVDWLDERGVDYGDFFHEYFDFEADIYSDAFNFIQAERIRKLERKLDKEKREPFVFSQDEYFILRQKYTTLEVEFRELKGSAENAKPVSERQRSAYLNIIAALLGLLLGRSSSGKPYSQFTSQQSIIDAIHGSYGDKSGLSKRNLEEKFSQAKRNLEGQ